MTEGITITEADNGQRLDRWLKRNYPGFGFGQLQKILRTGQLRVDGKRAKGETRLETGQVIRIPPQLLAPAPERKKGISPRDAEFIKSLVIYKDQHVMAINKPSGLAVQGGSKIERHVDGLLDGLLDDDGNRPRLVHRLDRDTSGVLLLARTTLAAQALGDMFKGRDIRKYYWAVTAPAPAQHQGKITVPLAKRAAGGGERVMAVDEEEGKSALTYYQVMETVGDKLAWVAFWPRTGRTHQIRVHALEIGCPLLGDYKYEEQQSFLAENPNLPKTLHLHARRIIMPHPITGRNLDISAPLDPDMKKTFKYFGFNADDKTDPFEILE
ncbi:MAG TPA: RluA family pseudouridine synthase [Patescibacteria group bacterium]|nr:RluA family pseudouridine synthase [Patescibacteria group bacterium]